MVFLSYFIIVFVNELYTISRFLYCTSMPQDNSSLDVVLVGGREWKTCNSKCSAWPCREAYEMGDYQIVVDSHIESKSDEIRRCDRHIPEALTKSLNHHYYPSYHVRCFPGGQRPQCLRYFVSQQMYNEFPTEIKTQFLDNVMFPGIIPWRFRPFLKIDEWSPIDRMTKKELCDELIKRDLPRRGLKSNNKLSLLTYIEDLAKQKYLVVGFCRSSESRYKLIMPLYLKQIVVDYFELFT